MRLRVVWFGRPGGSPFEAEIKTYRRRVTRRWPADEVSLKPAPGRTGDPVRALAAEAAAVRRHLQDGWHTVVLDERGRSRSSEELANRLGELEHSGRAGVQFVVGSDLGVAPSLPEIADETLSLGPLTLPHLLARLVLWEQLFRATHILGGGAYHRTGVQWRE